MATIQERINQLKSLKKSDLIDLLVAEEEEPEVDEPVDDDAPEVAEESETTDSTDGLALVKVKGTLTEFYYAERVVTREAEVLEDGTVTGGTLKTVVYNVYDSNGELVESLSESEFYRKYTTVDHASAAALKQEA